MPQTRIRKKRAVAVPALKLLAFIAGSFFLLILVLVVMGAVLPRHHVVSRSANYPVQPQKLFALINGLQNWRPDLNSSDYSTGANGAILLQETATDGSVITYEIYDVKPPTALKRRIVTPNLPYSGTWSFQLTPNGSGTTLRITEDGDVYNPVFRFLSKFVLGESSSIDNYLHELGKATGQDVTVQH